MREQRALQDPLLHNHYQYTPDPFLPSGDIVATPVPVEPAVYIYPDVESDVRKFHSTHPDVNLTPIINERIRDLLDECDRAERS